MRAAIIGAGAMGITLAHALAREGVAVDVFERGAEIGGLVARAVLDDGTAVDRFYHAILPGDRHVLDLCAEHGLGDGVRFGETRTGVYRQGRLYPLNTVLDLLRFPPLPPLDRLRLGATVLVARGVRDWERLEDVPVEEWLTRYSGRRAVDVLWRAMLRAKFDGGFADTPATYIWSRLVRVQSARSGAAQREGAGYLPGGYGALVEAMAQRVRGAGGEIHLQSPVLEIVTEGDRAVGVRTASGVSLHDAVVATVPLPALCPILPDAAAGYVHALRQVEHLDIICPLLVLDRPLSGYWTLYIAAEDVPFTGIIETTSYVDPAWVGGHHLVYLPKYVRPGSPWHALSDEEIGAVWFEHLQRMFPDFRREWVHEYHVHRAYHVEPLHGMHGNPAIPSIRTPIRRLYLAAAAQIYPALTNMESVTRHACEVARTVHADLVGHVLPAGDPRVGGTVAAEVERA